MNMFQKLEQLSKYANQYQDEYGKVATSSFFREDKSAITVCINKKYELFTKGSVTAAATYYLTARENSFDLELVISYIRDGKLYDDKSTSEPIFHEKPYESVEELYFVLDRIRSVTPVMERHLERIRRDSTTEEVFAGKIVRGIKAGIFKFDTLLREPKLPVYDLHVLQVATEVNGYVINRYPEARYKLKTTVTTDGSSFELSLKNTMTDPRLDSSVSIDALVYYSDGECGVGVSIMPENVVSGNVCYNLKPVASIGEIYEQIERAEVILAKAMKKMKRVTRSASTKEGFLNLIKEAVNINEFSVQKLEDEK